MTTTSWEKVFKTTPVPDWLRAFDRDPLAALEAALSGRFYFGSLNVAEPSDLLIDWATGIGERFDFINRLDAALTHWIAQNWGREPEDAAKPSRNRLTMTWIWALRLAANVDQLKQTPRALRKQFEQRQAFLEHLGDGPSRDPLGLYLLAVARHQEDDSLEEIWWEYCRLEDGIPWYHGVYGIAGLRGLPPRLESERGRFSERVAKGVIRLGEALFRRSEENLIGPDLAHREFNNIARLTMRAYPFPERWGEYWSDELDSGAIAPAVINWLEEFAPALPIPLHNIWREDFTSPAGDFVFAPEVQIIFDDIIASSFDREAYLYKSIVEINGVRGIGKSAFLRQLARQCQSRDNFYCAYVDCQSFIEASPSPTNSLIRAITEQIDVTNNFQKTILAAPASTQEDLTQPLLSYLQSVLTETDKQSRLALIFDSLDQADSAMSQSVFEVINTVVDSTRVLVAVAHDEPSTFAQDPRLKGKVFPYSLKEFDLSRTQQQLQAFDLAQTSSSSPADWGNAIYEITQGNPSANRFLAAVARKRNYKPEDVSRRKNELSRLIYREIIDKRIFKKISQAEKGRTLELLTLFSIPRSFNLISMRLLVQRFASVHKLLEVQQYGAMINTLKGFIRYSKAAAGYIVIPSLRNGLFHKLKHEQPAMFGEINKLLIEIYKEWITRAHGVEQTRFFLESIYHQAQFEKNLQKLLPQFEHFAQEIETGAVADENYHCKQQFIEEFEQDDLAKLFDPNTRTGIRRLFSHDANR